MSRTTVDPTFVTILFLCRVGNGRIGEMGYGELRPDAGDGGRALAFRTAEPKADTQRADTGLVTAIAAAETAKSATAVSL